LPVDADLHRSPDVDNGAKVKLDARKLGGKLTLTATASIEVLVSSVPGVRGAESRCTARDCRAVLASSAREAHDDAVEGYWTVVLDDEIVQMPVQDDYTD